MRRFMLLLLSVFLLASLSACGKTDKNDTQRQDDKQKTTQIPTVAPTATQVPSPTMSPSATPTPSPIPVLDRWVRDTCTEISSYGYEEHWQFEYDTTGKLLKEIMNEIDVSGTERVYESEYTYDGNSRSTVRFGFPYKETFDSEGRLLSKVYYKSDGITENEKWEYKYDDYGNTVEYYYWRTSYDENDPTIGSSEEHVYEYENGMLKYETITYVEPMWNFKREMEYFYEEDSKNPAYAVTTIENGKTEKTVYEYDKSGNMIKSMVPKYVYDENGNQIELSEPGIVKEYTYDEYGNCLKYQYFYDVYYHEEYTEISTYIPIYK